MSNAPRYMVEAACLAGILGVIGLVSWGAEQPLLAPSLASAAFVQVLTPTLKSAKPWSILVGQVAGLIGALVGVYVAGAAGVPPLEGTNPILGVRVLAVVIAIAVTVLLQRTADASSPAGGATAVLVAVGTETATIVGCIRVVLAILLVTVIGEAARRLLLRVQSEQKKHQ